MCVNGGILLLDVNDLKAIEQLLDKKFEPVIECFETVDKRFEAIDECFTKLEKKFIKEMDKRIRASENLLLETMDQDRKILEARMDQLDGRIDQLEQHTKIVKHDEDMTELILQKIDGLQSEVEEIKIKIA